MPSFRAVSNFDPASVPATTRLVFLLTDEAMRPPRSSIFCFASSRVMDVNVASIFLTCRAVVPVMRRQGGGKIVNISSGTPFRGVPFLLHYVTSKGAIVALTRALAKELGKDGILVNCVAPGFTMSDGVKDHPEVVEKLRDVSIAARTIQRDQTPEDIVGAVVYLSSASSDFVTGQTIVIDGGQYFH